MTEGGGFEMDDFDDREENKQNDSLDWDEYDPNLDSQTQETTFGQGLDTAELKKELLKQKLNDFYSHVEKETTYKLAIDLDPNQFKLAKEDILFAKWKTKWIQLTDKRNRHKVLSLSTIQGKTDVELIRRVLGLRDYQTRKTSDELAREKLLKIERRFSELHRILKLIDAPF